MRQISAILLTLPDGKIVLQRRDKDAPVNPGLLGLFGGHVEQGESHLDALQREVGEETSLDLTSLTWGFVQDFIVQVKNLREDVSIHLYWAEIPTMDFEVYEGDGAEAYTRTEILERDDLGEPARHVIANILKEK